MGRRKDVEAFVSANSRASRLIWVDEGARIRLLKPRTHTRLDGLAESVVRGRAVPVGASRELEAGMKRSAIILHGASLRRAAASAKWLRDGIREITSDAIGTR